VSGVIRHEVFVRCPGVHAFEVFTARVDQWWPRSHRRLVSSRIQLGQGVGGRLEEHGDGRVLVLGEVLVWEPPARVELSWALGAPSDAHTRVAVRFAEEPGGTRVQVEHVEGPRPLPDWTVTSKIFDVAWQHVLAALSAHVHAGEHA
jgi:uncharacterized protein YndB with AHSA1/START domain